MAKSIEERMAEKMAARIQKVETESKNFLISIKKEEVETLSYIDTLTEDKNIQDMLKENTLKLLNITSNASLELGKIFKTVEEELSKKGSPNGVYVKFLEYVGYNRMTALRHKHRYELFILTDSEKSKLLIATLPVRLIEEAYLNKDEIKEFLNEGITREELENLLTSKKIENAKNKELGFEDIFVTVDIKERVNKIYTSLKKIKNLDDNKKKELENLLGKIEELLEN